MNFKYSKKSFYLANLIRKLQKKGIKKGIMEWADLIVMNKADGDLLPIAKRSAAELRGALTFLPSKSSDWKPKIQICSSLEKKHIEEIWATMKNFNQIKTVISLPNVFFEELKFQIIKNSGEKAGMRGQQRLRWMWKLIEEDLITKFKEDPRVSQLLDQLQKQVEAREITPGAAADQLTSIFFLPNKKDNHS